MPFPQFFFWNALGGLTWGVTYGLVGYFGGKAAAHVLAEAEGLRGVQRVLAELLERAALRRGASDGGPDDPRPADPAAP